MNFVTVQFFPDAGTGSLQLYIYLQLPLRDFYFWKMKYQ